MNIKKNDICRISITDIDTAGAGIGRLEDGLVLFVKDTVPGDEAFIRITKLKKTYGYARLEELITPSPYRVTPKCPAARQCGGCQLQHLAYGKQLEYKEHKVRELLTRVGGAQDFEMLPVIGMEDPWYYRNKAQFPVGLGRDGKPKIGFYAARTHVIVDSPVCPIQCKESGKVRETVRQWLEEKIEKDPEAGRELIYDESAGTGLLRHVLVRTGAATGEIMVCLVVNGKKLPDSEGLVSRLREIPGMTSVMLNINRGSTNVIMGSETRLLWGKDYICDRIEDIEYRISAASFYQVNPAQTAKLYRTALEMADPGEDETVWDLYCGTGTITLFASKRAASVMGVEVVPEAVENARQNAELSGISNVRFLLGKAEDVVPAEHRQHGISADIIIVDPPRKGCDRALIDCMVKVAPKKIVYVSCDPATLARDVKLLREGGYRLVKAQPVDMFPQTVGIETVCLLSKLSEAKHHISVQVDMDELDLTAAESKATYEEIQEWVKEKYGFHVSHLNIAKTKHKCGIIERQNYNLPKSENSRSPETPKEKEEAIIEAFRHFQMI
ncbi:MAG: 23S rRNA (uracil(1939)-C(5))-methyltransferase RlmD [Lachnospiraceae bacterium]|nr:23S rRNA (uracil(1939)-C(5))-methyltransferase RlmD [Lachnospiraceae bacterium]